MNQQDLQVEAKDQSVNLANEQAAFDQDKCRSDVHAADKQANVVQASAQELEKSMNQQELQLEAKDQSVNLADVQAEFDQDKCISHQHDEVQK